MTVLKKLVDDLGTWALAIVVWTSLTIMLAGAHLLIG